MTRLTFAQMARLGQAARPGGWAIGNTNATADVLMRRGLIEVVEYLNNTYLVIYRPTVAGYEKLNTPHGSKPIALADVPVTRL